MATKLYNTLVSTYIKTILICITKWIEVLIDFIKQIKHKALCNERILRTYAISFCKLPANK